jgi:hypothetical protein
VASASGHFHGFRVEAPDDAWRRCVQALQASDTHLELAHHGAAGPAGAAAVAERAHA